MLEKRKVKYLAKKVVGKIKREQKNPAQQLAEKVGVKITKDKEHVWAFTSGDLSDSFQGNPKYLFVYINNYRADIESYWLTKSQEMAEFIRSNGYRAYVDGTVEAEYIKSKTGVLVAEYVKIEIPTGLESAKYLNLYHGVGSKPVEHSITEGPLFGGMVKKYITHNRIFRNQQLFLATSPMIEENFRQQCQIDEDKIIRAGYPRCLYQKYYKKIETYDHDLRKEKGLSQDAKLAVYAPTFRTDGNEMFGQAIQDMEVLIQCCERNNILLIFKMHPKIENEYSFLLAKEKYGDCKNLLFWDNKYDFYEVLDQMDLVIVDYSSIINDFLAAGVTNVIRYVYDFEEYKENIIYDYDEVTTGRKAFSFEELIECIDEYENVEKDFDGIDRLMKMYWEYSSKDSLEKIVEQTLNFKKDKRVLPTLYSFDIFDTLFSRKVLQPHGIFQYVEYKIRTSEENFPYLFREDYVGIRRGAESNAREYYRKTKIERDTDCIEITFDMIFDRMIHVYGLDENLAELLKQWEIEAELNNVYPLYENIERLKKLVNDGEKVILISDMYLSKEIILEMLAKADPLLPTLPLFLSCEYGVQKSGLDLFKEVYKSFEPQYGFGKWIHSGDNMHSDVRMPEKLGILTRRIEPTVFNDFESGLSNFINSYDGTLAAALMARFRKKYPFEKDEFAYSYVGSCFIPYINWVIRDAVEKGYEKLYFLSRDGHQLKRIADEIIKEKGLSIKTKYIYGSRRAWRIPSFIDHIDVGFWGGYGNFVKITSRDKLLKALDLEEEEFVRIFPILKDITDEEILEKGKMSSLIEMFRNSQEYQRVLLEKAKNERKNVCGYLKQEIEVNEKFAVVEFWGRGYTQECFTRLWHEASGTNDPVAFYYARTVLPTEGDNIRYNFTSNPGSLLFVEAIFANIPYKSIEEYCYENGKYEPVIKPIECDMDLFHAMERDLVLFARDFSRAEFCDVKTLEQKMFAFIIQIQNESKNYPLLVKVLSELYDSVEMFGKKKEFAPRVTYEQVEQIRQGEVRTKFTSNMDMSFARKDADEKAKQYLMDLYQFDENDNFNGGKKLTPAEYKRKKDYEKQLDELKDINRVFISEYNNITSDVSVKNKIVFLSEEKNSRQTEFYYLLKKLEKQSDISYQLISLYNIKSEEIKNIAKDIAESKIIIASQRVKILSEIKLREESKLIILGYSAYPYLKRGVCRNFYVKAHDKFNKKIWRNDVKAFQVASEATQEYYTQMYGTVSSNIEYIGGCCATDVFFDQEYLKWAKEKLYMEFPEAKSKKVIAYIPAIKYRNKKLDYLNVLDMEALERLAGDEYVVVIHLRNEVKKMGALYNIDREGFSKDMTGILSAREQLSVADIIVGDYRDVYFEGALLDKPIFSVGSDVIQYCKENPPFEYYEDIQPGPIIADAEELAENLKKIEDYDYTLQRNFKEKYLTYCDGKSTERLWDYINNVMQNQG